MNQADLARCAAVSEAHISRLFNGHRAPGFELCLQLADGLNLSPVTVLRRAQLIQEPLEVDEQRDEWIQLYDKLTELDRLELIALARLRLAYRRSQVEK